MEHQPIELPLVISAGLSLLAAGNYATAALHKIRTFIEFTGFVDGYRLLPGTLIKPASLVVVGLEMAAVAGALFSLPWLEYLPAAMLTLYAAAMGINLSRGRTDIDCGCGGTPMPLSLALVLRNLVLAASFFWAAGTGGILTLAVSQPELVLIAFCFALTLGISYASFNQLQANKGIYQRLWVPSS